MNPSSSRALIQQRISVNASDDRHRSPPLRCALQGRSRAPSTPGPLSTRSDLHRDAWFLYDEGRSDGALLQVERARRDPLSRLAATAEAHLLLLAGEPERADERSRAVAAREPDYPYAHYTRGLVLERLDRHAEAVAAFERARAVGEGAPKYTLRLGLAYAEAGRLDGARRMLSEARRAALTRHVSPDELADLESRVRAPDPNRDSRRTRLLDGGVEAGREAYR